MQYIVVNLSIHIYKNVISIYIDIWCGGKSYSTRTSLFKACQSYDYPLLTHPSTLYLSETGHDPAVHGARLEDRFYNNDSFQSPSTDPGDPQQQDAALKIQTEFRRHHAEQEVEHMKEEDAAVKIQSGFRGYQDRQKVLEMK